MRTKKFWLDALERAIKTLAQTLLAWLVVDQAIWELDWQQGLGVAATATVASILGSIASAGVAQPDTASLVDATPGKHHKGQ